MSINAEVPDGLTSLSNRSVKNMLRGLEEEERVLSGRRRHLHDRIDQLRVRQDDPTGSSLDLLGELQYQEQRLSERRLLLHQRIAELRIEIGDRCRSLRTNLTLVR
jgi:predicted  nucleic acid-binding Zn-ribbon protein